MCSLRSPETPGAIPDLAVRRRAERSTPRRVSGVTEGEGGLRKRVASRRMLSEELLANAFRVDIDKAMRRQQIDASANFTNADEADGATSNAVR